MITTQELMRLRSLIVISRGCSNHILFSGTPSQDIWVQTESVDVRIYSGRKGPSLSTYWGRDKMADIFQTTCSNAFSWMKMFEIGLKFLWSLFLRVKLTIFQHRIGKWLGAVRVTRHYLNQWWLVYRRICASIAPNELINEKTIDIYVIQIKNVLSLRMSLYLTIFKCRNQTTGCGLYLLSCIWRWRRWRWLWWRWWWCWRLRRRWRRWWWWWWLGHGQIITSHILCGSTFSSCPNQSGRSLVALFLLQTLVSM